MLKRVAGRIVSVALLLTAVLVVVLPFTRASSRVGAEGRVQERRTLIPSPDTWVAFAAELSRTGPGSPAVVGRFFQGEDGSDRTESGPTLQDIRVISIHNMSRERYYIYTDQTGWTEHPMQLTSFSKQPRKIPTNIQNLVQSPVDFEGHTAYLLGTASGTQAVLVPALNFFVVDRRTPGGGRTRYSNVQFGPVDAALFEPPNGVSVKWNPKPAGRIVRTPTP
jgi:hypothetical protein